MLVLLCLVQDIFTQTNLEMNFQMEPTLKLLKFRYQFKQHRPI